MKDKLRKIKNIVIEKNFKYIYFFCLILSIQFILGYKLQKFEYTARNGKEVLINIINIIILSVVLTTIVYIGKYIIKQVKEKVLIKNKETISKTNTIKQPDNLNVMSFLIIILCWMPAFLAFCPAILNYDGPSQIIAYIVVGEKMTTQQPLISTIMMTAFFKFGINVLGSSTLGMMCFSLFQMCFMAEAFAYTVNFIWKETYNKKITVLALIFYAFFPFNHLFPLMTTKDTMFAGLTLFFVVQIYQFPREKFRIKEYIILSIFAVFMLLFRNNAVYALVVALPIMMIFLRNNKKKIFDMTTVFVIIFIVYILCFEGLIIVTNSVMQSDREKLSVISQAIARVSKRAIVIERYEQNPQEFYKLFLSMVEKYPIICIDSFLDTIRGYWYIFDNSFNKIFHKESPETKGCLEITFYIVTDENEENMVRDLNQFPELRSFYKSMFCQNNYTKIPVLYIVFQPAIYFYSALACLLYAIYKKDKNLVLPTIYLFLYFLTCFLGPGAIIRYIYANIVATPFILAMCKNNKK